MPSQHLPTQLSAIRFETEAHLEHRTPDNASEHSTRSLLHELQAHQIELEMQNEQLRRTQIALEESRDRYFDLYQSVPAALLSLNISGQITEANRTAAALLGESHAELRHSSFARLVVAEDQARWNQCFDLALKHGGPKECPLDMRRKNGSLFNGHLYYSLVSKSGGVPELRIALTDITSQKNAERARSILEARLSRLTQRQRDVLALAIAGTPNKTISHRLGINQRTVENHRAHIHKKTGVDSLLELAQQAAVAGVSLDAIA